MASYISGDDFLGGAKKKKVAFKRTKLGKLMKRTVVGKAITNIGKVALIPAKTAYSAVKFVANPAKEFKAAMKTVSRFDPTSKTAKYRNIGRLAVGIATGGAGLLTVGGIMGTKSIAKRMKAGKISKARRKAEAKQAAINAGYAEDQANKIAEQQVQEQEAQQPTIPMPETGEGAGPGPEQGGPEQGVDQGEKKSMIIPLLIAAGAAYAAFNL